MKQWAGSNWAEPGSVFARLTPPERRRLLAWLEGKTEESEAMVRSLLVR